ncbi:MAG: glycosyltransferase family 2 protein [Rhodospirillaceae bacterium]|jgi:glycosyltransferase involved in cell wall biosynthesis|nr:glycosyltransferase family 2 protein [Rhodospirillaceae bacterium]MBT5242871.1 glycosyltransferase family 2 protein [Rhodospirillaceae bacterium]MBT5563095.1 glycosyltransferase family 2 protein [Rhodospirillaceae bacterium]MBT6243410.1 glycosyltransferase family 2 protein [Rhodospirillaceae bacterium]MBT7138519.1 glycosyltransferase family 2 protein [Rhodospirillaceae bacterium]
MKVALLVFTWNEVEGMKVIMPRVDSDLFHQIIIVDGGSTDGTIEWAREQGYQVHVQTQKGLRHAYNEALELVTGDIVITFSPDGNSIPELLPDLIAKMEDGFDMVIASRYLDGAKSEDDSLITAFGNWLFTATVNVLYGGSYTDCMVIYRAWRSSLYKELDIHLDETFEFYEKLYRTKLGIEPLLSVRALKRNLKVGEIPGDEPPRIGGHRKLQIIKWGLSFYTSFFRELWFWK